MNNSPSYHHHHHHHHHQSKNKDDYHHHDPESILENEKKKNNLGSTMFLQNINHTTFNHVVQQPQTNNQNRILKITWFLSSDRNKDNNDGKQQHKPYFCRVCDKVFSSNKALNGHMRMRWHTQKGCKKGSAISSLSEQNKRSNYDHQDQSSAKRTKRIVIDDDVRNAAQSLMDMSRGKFLNFNVDDHPDYVKG